MRNAFKTVQDSTDLISILNETMDGLRALLSTLQADGGAHPSVVRDASRLATAISSLCGEVRQNQRQARRQLALYSRDDIAAYVRSWSKDDQDSFIAELTGRDDDRPLL